MTQTNDLLNNIGKIHTTAMGINRIKRNLGIEVNDVVDYCKKLLLSQEAVFERWGKNWYVWTKGCILTVNGSSYTIITAHKEKQVKMQKRD